MQARLEIKTVQRGTSVEQLVQGMDARRVGKVIGPRAREVTRDHLKRNPRNKKGWPTTGFWEDAARGTTWELDEAGNVLLKINKLGVRQRYYGGPIRAVSRRMLTIPIASQAYGKTAADFPGSFIITTPKGAYIVQYGGSVSKTGRGINKHNATLEFLFKLKAFVVQNEDKSVIPGEAVLVNTALAAINDHFKAVKAGGGK